MDKYRDYSNREEEYTRKYGENALAGTAKITGRSSGCGAIGKIKRLRLRGISKSGESINISRVAKMFGVDRKTIKGKWVRAGLKINSCVLKTKKAYHLIRYADLLAWLESNIDLWDSRRLGFFALGVEPVWLKAKRNKDNNLPARAYRNYTKEEDQQIWYLFIKGYQPQHIADLMGRTKLSVIRRLDRIRREKRGKKN